VDGVTSRTREDAVSAAGEALDAELAQAPIDKRHVDILRACSRGGCAVLQAFCGAVEDPANALDEPPAIALVGALAEPDAVDRAVRAVTWIMLAQRAASAWPSTFTDALDVARTAMPVDLVWLESMRTLGWLTACANTTADPDLRDGQRMQFSRESLEHLVAAVTYRRPARRDMLMVIPPWTTCFVHGIKVCDARLRELEQQRSS
jgi:hypothetical protein